jgi:hypothetical protein
MKEYLVCYPSGMRMVLAGIFRLVLVPSFPRQPAIVNGQDVVILDPRAKVYCEAECVYAGGNLSEAQEGPDSFPDSPKSV